MMNFDHSVIIEFKKYSPMTIQKIKTKLSEISRYEYESWLNNKMYFSRLRDLHIRRLSQFMEKIWNYRTPTAESIAFLFQVTLTSARSLIKDFKAQYGRRGYTDSIKGKKGAIEVALHNDSQFDELFEIVRQIATDNPKISEPNKVKNKSYVIAIEKSTAVKIIEEINRR
jgi:hypothetical protein